MANKENILIVAGEPSGDLQASFLVKSFSDIAPEIHFWGFGGEKMRQVGVETIVDVEKLAVMGLFDVIKEIPRFRKYMKDLIEQTKIRRPIGAILVDYPGFNLRLAKKLKTLDIPIGYYISPQFWAWASWRVSKVKNYVDKMVCILPFEPDFYRKHNIDVDFVGHPFIDTVKPELSENEFRKKFGINGDFIVFLPGSRKKEIVRLLPEMLKTYEIIESAKKLIAVIAEAPGTNEIISKILKENDAPSEIKTVEDFTYSAMSYAKAGIIASGSATIEALICGLPAIVVYRVDSISWAIGKYFINVPHIALANLVANERIYPEFIQKFTPNILAENFLKILDDKNIQAKMKDKSLSAKSKLGKGNSPSKAAKIFEKLFMKQF
ncbi:lipid-A-disaccharide synthase [bacterium]|nr:lipid-A-disaccharide synthase [bacterium]